MWHTSHRLIQWRHTGAHACLYCGLTKVLLSKYSLRHSIISAETPFLEAGQGAVTTCAYLSILSIALHHPNCLLLSVQTSEAAHAYRFADQASLPYMPLLHRRLRDLRLVAAVAFRNQVDRCAAGCKGRHVGPVATYKV